MAKKANTSQENMKSRSEFSNGMRRFLKNKLAVFSLIIIAIIVFSCIFANFITDKDYTELDLENCYGKMSAEHPLGTDSIGRDTLSRMLYGGRNTLKISFMSIFLSAIGGTIIGLVSGFFGGVLDNIVMRIVDAVSAIPTVLLVVVMECALGWGKGNYMYAMAISFLPPFTKVIRAAVMNIMGSEYIEAARALGVSKFNIILKHIIHNITSPLIIQVSNTAAESLLTCTIIGYLGFGFGPPEPEWGLMAANGYSSIRVYPLAGLVPSVTIVICALALNLVGNGMRDAFDTREKVI